jgi:hypothetical protein
MTAKLLAIIIAEVFAFELIHLHGPGNQIISLNPNEVVALRSPQSSEHFAKGIQCLVATADGKFATVLEDCDTIEKMLEGIKK